MGLFDKLRKGDSIDIRERIDLREKPSAPKTFEFGFPTPCPECNSPGYLDHIDPFRRVQYQHCTSCFHKWELAEAEVAALNA